MMHRAVLTSLLAVATASAAFAQVETYTIDKGHSEASFQVRHMVTKVRGRFTDFEGTIVFDRATPARSRVAFRIKTASVNTDVQRRDDHLRSQDFFWAEKYPEITFDSTAIVARGSDTFDVTGTLTIRGVAKTVTLPVTFLGGGKSPRGQDLVGFETSTTISRREFGLLWNAPTEAGYLVGDEVSIAINIEAVKQVAPPPTPAS